MPPPEAGEWMSSQAAADYLGLTRESLYRLIDEGVLPAYGFSGDIRLKRWEVEAFVDRTRIQPGSLRHLYSDAADAAPDSRGRDDEPSPREDQMSSRMIERIDDALLKAAAETPPDLNAREDLDR